MENLSQFSLDQLKTLHNTRLAQARDLAQGALDVRKAIVEKDAAYSGSSKRRLENAVEDLFLARTFANAPHDLAASENAYRRNN